MAEKYENFVHLGKAMDCFAGRRLLGRHLLHFYLLNARNFSLSLQQPNEVETVITTLIYRGGNTVLHYTANSYTMTGQDLNVLSNSTASSLNSSSLNSLWMISCGCLGK